MNNNETILKFKEVKPETISVIKDAITDGTKEEILKVIDFKDNLKSKNVNDNTIKYVEPIIEPSIIEDDKNKEIKESGEVVGQSAVEIPDVTVPVDYEVVDLTDIVEQMPEFTKAPRQVLDISDVLAKIDAHLTESQGESYGTINILFTRSAKDRICESALLEYRTRGKVYTLSLCITEGAKEGYYKLRVNNTLGKKIFERETKSPKMLIESYFKAINFKVLAEKVLLTRQELTEDANPILTTIKRFLKKEGLEGLVNISGTNPYTVTITDNGQFLSSKGTEFSWDQFQTLHELIKKGFPNSNISDIDEGVFTFQEK